MTGNDRALDAPRTRHGSQLPIAGWAFVALAAVQAVIAAQSLDLHVRLVPAFVFQPGYGTLSAVLNLVARVATVLLPAAILYGAPDAWHRQRLLLVGTALVAAWTVAVPAVVGIAVAGNEIPTWASLLPLLGVVYLVGALLVAAGLLRLRRTSPSRRAHLISLAAMIAIALPDAIASVTVGLDMPLGPLLFALAFAAATGYALSVPVGAWLDGEPARPFWPALAVVSLAQLAVSLLNAAFILAATRESLSTSPIGVGGTVAAIAAVATLWIYARLLPEPERAV